MYQIGGQNSRGGARTGESRGAVFDGIRGKYAWAPEEQTDPQVSGTEESLSKLVSQLLGEGRG